MKLTFSGERALILGGTSDLAIHLARALLEEGMTLALTYRKEKGRAKIVSALSGDFKKFITIFLDFSWRETLENLARSDFDAPDYLVDFAQPDYERLIASADMEDVYRYFEASVSFRAAVLHRVGRGMLRKKRGRCIFISSTAAKRPNPGQGFYASSKLASEALYKSLGLELGARGITSVVVRPGYVDSGRGERYFRTGDSDRVLGSVPIKRPIAPSEMTDTILYLLSDSAGGFNATEVCIDGGLVFGKQDA